MVDLGTPQTVDPAARTPTSFKGWQVVAASFWILGVSSGLGFYALAIYLDTLTDEGGFTVGQVSGANFCFFVMGGLGGLLAARLIARHDLRIVMAVGAVIAGAALGLVGQAEELWLLYLLYIVFGLGWALCGLVPSMTVVTRWFHRRRSMALSIASTGLSVGGIICTPIVKQALEHNDMSVVMPWIGAVFAIAIVPVALFVAIPSPAVGGPAPRRRCRAEGRGPGRRDRRRLPQGRAQPLLPLRHRRLRAGDGLPGRGDQPPREAGQRGGRHLRPVPWCCRSWPARRWWPGSSAGGW